MFLNSCLFMTSGGVWSVLRWNGLTGGHWLLRALVKCQIIEKAVTRQAFTTEDIHYLEEE